MAAIDDAMVAVMTANMLRGASLAIVHGTRLVYAKGYTMAEAGYPDVQPTTFFRQASVSKMFTAAAIYQLIDEGAHLPGSTLVLALDTHLSDCVAEHCEWATGGALERHYDSALAGDDERRDGEHSWF